MIRESVMVCMLVVCPINGSIPGVVEVAVGFHMQNHAKSYERLQVKITKSPSVLPHARRLTRHFASDMYCTDPPRPFSSPALFAFWLNQV